MFFQKRNTYVPEAPTLEIDCWDDAPIAPAVRVPSETRLPLRVLILDDEEDFRAVVEHHLSSRFDRITSVSNGVEGLREIQKDPFDLILCDIMMPRLGGEMFYWAVTRLRPAARLKFLFITGHRNDPKILSFFERVQATVLFKPFRLDALDSAISEVLKKVH